MKPHKLRFGESVRVSGGALDVAPTADRPVGAGGRHWQGERAWLLWRDGAPELRDEPAAAPPPEGALFRWRESVTEVVVTARTRLGLPDGAVELRAAPTSADVLVDGSPTPWCGMLCGRVEPARCRVAVVAGAAADDHDTLQLTLVKAERRLWRAPWRELIADVDAREGAGCRGARRSCAASGPTRRVRRRGPSSCRSRPPRRRRRHARRRRRRLPLVVRRGRRTRRLAGELHGRLDPVRCSWTVARARRSCPARRRPATTTERGRSRSRCARRRRPTGPTSSRRGTSDRATVDVKSDFQFRSRLRSLAL